MYTIRMYIEGVAYYVDKREKISIHSILTNEAEKKDLKEFNSIEEAVGFIYIHPELFSDFMEHFPIEYVMNFQIWNEDAAIQYKIEGYWDKKFLLDRI